MNSTQGWNFFINDEFWNSVSCQGNQPGCRVNNKRSTYHHNNISFGNKARCFFNQWYRLFKPDDMRAQLSSIFCQLPELDVAEYRINKGWIFFTSHFKNLPMQMEHFR